jgi:hypothetical protein
LKPGSPIWVGTLTRITTLSTRTVSFLCSLNADCEDWAMYSMAFCPWWKLNTTD